MENEHLAVEAATVLLTKDKDSTLVDYTVTNAKGAFEIKVKRQSEAVSIIVSMLGYEDFKKAFESIDEPTDLGAIYLKAISTDLEEVVIQAEVPPIRVKTDTLEFNASSFKVRPDANVEELLKRATQQARYRSEI